MVGPNADNVLKLANIKKPHLASMRTTANGLRTRFGKKNGRLFKTEVPSEARTRAENKTPRPASLMKTTRFGKKTGKPPATEVPGEM